MAKHHQRGFVGALWWGGLLLVLSAGQAHALQVGDHAPDFSLPATMVDRVQLADYQGRKSVVVYFFTASFGGA
jgi:AhpC/TSA family